MEKKRPMGITIIGIVLIVWPSLYLLRIFMTLCNLNSPYFISMLPDIQKPIFVLMKVLYIICGIGILRLARLARILVICISLFGIVMWIAAIILQTPLALLNKLMHIVIYMGLCGYFTRPKVKEQFK
jgi:hypothetical protein